MNHDSPSDGTEQEWVAERVAEWLAPAGCTSRWVREPDGPARSMVVTLPGDGGPMVALLGHTDTVFPVGHRRAAAVSARGRSLLRARRGRHEGRRAPRGGRDRAARRGARAGRSRRCACWCAPTRRRGCARRPCAPRRSGAAAALVFECARENGDLVSERKGAIWRTLRLHGRPAHAGADTHRGRSAVSALAHEILRIEALTAGPARDDVGDHDGLAAATRRTPSRARPGPRSTSARACPRISSSRSPSSSATGPTTASPARSRTAAPGRRCRGPAWLADLARSLARRSGPRDRRAALGRRLGRLLDRRRRHPHPRRPGARRRRRPHAGRVDRDRDARAAHRARRPPRRASRSRLASAGA